MDKRTISVSLPEELIEKIDEQSSEIGINRSAYMTVILFDYFKKEELMKNFPDMISKMSSLAKDVKDMNKMTDLFKDYVDEGKKAEF